MRKSKHEKNIESVKKIDRWRMQRNKKRQFENGPQKRRSISLLFLKVIVFVFPKRDFTKALGYFGPCSKTCDFGTYVAGRDWP
jgi:hypothetical protein